MSDYKEEIDRLHERVTENRDKISFRVAQTEATAHNTKGQIDLFKWVITGLTIGFYGICYWLVNESISTRTALVSLESRVQGVETRIQGLETRMQGLENEVQELKVLILRLVDEEQ